MSRSGYSDDCEGAALVCWRGAVASAMRGKRGQAFLREMLAALDAMPTKRLITEEIVKDGECCAIGSVAIARGMDVSNIDPEDRDDVAAAFGIAPALAAEIAYENDEGVYRIFENGKYRPETPEERYERMHRWVLRALNAGKREGE